MIHNTCLGVLYFLTDNKILIHFARDSSIDSHLAQESEVLWSSLIVTLYPLLVGGCLYLELYPMLFYSERGGGLGISPSLKNKILIVLV